jgi:GABA(A) receptor-associated protein
MVISFKQTYTFQQRFDEAARTLNKYPDKIPIICEKNKKDTSDKLLEKKKYLIPSDFTIGQFVYIIRKGLKMPPEQAIYLFVNGTLPSNASIISTLYSKYKDLDNFLYIYYSFENIFG